MILLISRDYTIITIAEVIITGKRQDTRVRVTMELSISELIKNDQYIQLPKPAIATIIDISSSGLLISFPLNLPIGTCFCVKLNLNDDMLSVIIMIVRKENIQNEVYYGCKFLSLDNLTEQKIRRFVFDQQVKNRRKGNAN